MIHLLVLVASAAILSYEVLLTRVFAITQWNHLSFVIISVAMLGMAAAGVYLNTRSAGTRPSPPQTSLTVLSLSILLSFVVVNGMPVDYFQLFLDPMQPLLLLGVFLALAVPFFAAGMVTASAYVSHANKSHRLYLASMGGSALGSLLPLATIPLIGLRGSVGLSALLPLAPLLLRGPHTGRGWTTPAATVGCLALTVVVVVTPLADVRANPYKTFSHLMKTPGLVHVDRQETSRGRFDVVEGPALRYAPGLSLSYRKAPPTEHVVVRDGDSRHFLYDDPLDFTGSTLSHAGYVLASSPRRTLVLESHGGMAVAAALAGSGAEIEVVVDHPILADHYAGHYRNPRLNVITSPHRLFLTRSGNTYDLIEIDAQGPALEGMSALDQDHLFTVEGLRAALSRLSDRGVLVLTRRAAYPPNDFARVLATVWRALDTPRPWENTAILRSWDSITIIASPTLLALEGSARLREFADAMSFDLVWLPDIGSQELNRYNVLADPIYHRTVRALVDSGPDDQMDPLFDLRAATDDRPFPNHFLRWRSLAPVTRAIQGRSDTALVGGEAIVLLALALALFCGVGLLVATPVLARRRPDQVAAAYFFLIGAAFILVEMGWIKTATLVMGDPTVGFSLSLFSLLLSAAIGGRLFERQGQVRLPFWMFILAGLACCAFGATRWTVGWVMTRGMAFRVGLLLLGIAPLGLLMGLPFPAGMKFLARGSWDRAYGWAGGGVAAVLASVLSAQIAMDIGISYLFLAGAGVYLLAALIARRSMTDTWPPMSLC